MHNIYRPIDPENFPIGEYYLNKHGIPPKFTFNTHQLKSKISSLIKILEENGFTLTHRLERFEENQISLRNVYECGDTLIEFGTEFNYELDSNEDTEHHADSVEYLVILSIDEDEYSSILKKIRRVSNPKAETKNRVSLVVETQMSGYDTLSFELPKQTLDIETNYGNEFTEIHTTIIESLNKKNGKGLVLLHGTPGTGKTFYLKYLASKIKDKEILFIPPFLTDFLVSPKMIPFLLRKKNSILFIEDAEKVITDRNEESSVGVSNILNLTDGILSDILNIQVVATFNMDKKKIDPALLRKGRLIAEHEFSKLSITESNVLLKKLGQGHVTNEPMTLTEIYNFNNPEYKSKDMHSNPIGF